MGISQSGHPFQGAEAKLNRAEEHLLDLDREIGQYLDAEPFGTVVYHVPGSRLVQVAWRVIEQPSIDLSPLLGDCLHNLRSALDHIAWELVLRAGKTPSTNTRYPIVKKKTKPVNVSPGIEFAAQALVEESQPYQHGEEADGHPLNILNDLAVRDKHKTLNLVAAGLLDAEVYLVNPDESVRFGGRFTKGTTKHDDLIAQFMLPPDVPAVPEDWDIEISGTVFVALEEPGPWDGLAITPILEGILNIERSMLEGFRGLSGEAAD